MEWGCTKCGVEISQDREFCDECEAKQFRKIGGFLYLPLIGLVVGAASYLFALTDVLKVISVNYWHINTEARVFS
jgi:hypothetical protein